MAMAEPINTGNEIQNAYAWNSDWTFSFLMFMLICLDTQNSSNAYP